MEHEVMTEEMREKESLLDVYSDVYKSVFGVRPELTAMKNLTVAELRRELNELDAMYDWRAHQVEVEFEAGIAAMMKYGAPDRETAIRWMEQF